MLQLDEELVNNVAVSLSDMVIVVVTDFTSDDAAFLEGLKQSRDPANMVGQQAAQRSSADRVGPIVIHNLKDTAEVKQLAQSWMVRAPNAMHPAWRVAFPDVVYFGTTPEVENTKGLRAANFVSMLTGELCCPEPCAAIRRHPGRGVGAGRKRRPSPWVATADI